MKNTYEKNDITGAAKKFGILYTGLLLLVLYITDIIGEASDISIGSLTTIRMIAMFITIILLGFLLTKSVIKKFNITKSFGDSLRFNLNLIIIGIAVISIFYFLIALNSNVKKLKNSSQYKFASMYLDEDEIEEIIDDAKSTVRKQHIKVWVSILLASAVSIGLEGKIIDKYCLEDGFSEKTDDNYEEVE